MAASAIIKQVVEVPHEIIRELISDYAKKQLSERVGKDPVGSSSIKILAGGAEGTTVNAIVTYECNGVRVKS